MNNMNKNIKIRNEIAADILAIENLTKAAFMNALHADHTEQFIVNALRKAHKLSLSLVAEQNGVVVGHVAISPVTISDGSDKWYGLGPISVAPELQRQGIGSQLMEEVLKILKSQGALGCVVLGDPDYYGRFGFEADAKLFYADVPPEYFQVYAFDSEVPTGEVFYHEAFNAQG